MWKCLLQFIAQKRKSISRKNDSKLFYQSIKLTVPCCVCECLCKRNEHGILEVIAKEHWCWYEEHSWQENSQPRFPPQKRDQNPSQRWTKVWEWEAESWRGLSLVITIPKVEGTQDMIETPSSMVHALPPARSQQRYQLCRGDSHAINLCYEWSKKSQFPTWGLKHSERGRQQAYGVYSQGERMP